MANPERGEVTLTLPPSEEGGSPREYTLKLSMNAAVTLEARLKKKVGEVLAEAATLSFGAIRDIVWLLLQKHHAKDFPNTDQGRLKVGDLIDDAGGMRMFFQTLQELGALNAPTDEKGKTAGADPLVALDGRGADSTSRPEPLM